MVPSTAVPQWALVDFIHRGPWWRNRGIFLLNLWLLLPLMTSAMNGFDSSLVNGLQILPDWQNYYQHPEGKTLGLINSAQMIGGIGGLPFAPFISDTFGRRATLFVGSSIMLVGVAGQAMAPTVKIFIGARILIGFGLTFSVNASPLLVTELAYPTQRGKISSVYNTSWYIGSILSAWICFGAFGGAEGSVWSWRIPTLVQALPALIQVLTVWFMPESPRYLVNKGLESQAVRILARFHASGNGGDDHDPLVVFEMAQIRHALKKEKELVTSTSLWSLVATQGNRKRMRIVVGIAAFSQWSGNGLVSYYINLVLEGVGITGTKEKAAINGGLQIFNFCIALFGAMLVDKVGRRPLFITSNVGMLITFAMWTLTTALFQTLHNSGAAIATIPLIFVFFFFYDVAYTPMLVSYTLEILPYSIRAKGFAVMNMTVYLTNAFNQFVNPWALDAMNWKYYLVYVGWLGLELLFILAFVVETKGRTLEETAAMFDGEDKETDLAQVAGEAATLQIMSQPENNEGSNNSPHSGREKRERTTIVSLEMRPTSGRPDSWSDSEASPGVARSPSGLGKFLVEHLEDAETGYSEMDFERATSTDFKRGKSDLYF